MKIDWFAGKAGPLFKPVKLPTKISVRQIKKKNLTWPQAQKKYPKIKMFGDADKDGKLNMFDCKPFDKKRHGFTKFKLRSPRNVDSFTAAERFGGKNLKKLKKIGSGRDRVVYNLDKDKVIKIAKNPGGMRQNMAENDWNLNSSGIRPSFYEAGKDYVVMEKAKKLSPDKRKKLRKVSSAVTVGIMNNRNPYHHENQQMTARALKEEFPEQADDFDELLNYNIVPGDIAKDSSWGEKDGDIVLVDAGGMSQQDLLREHRITKMKERQSELRVIDGKEEPEDEDRKNAHRRLANEKALLDAEIEEWEDVKRERAQFKNKGKEYSDEEE